MAGEREHAPAEYHQPVEEYLETMLSLAEEGVPVIQARIAERLGRSAPSVSEMLERLTEDGYVTREGRRLSLTESGRNLAEKVVRKHRLAERLLVDVIGLEWHKVHRDLRRRRGAPGRTPRRPCDLPARQPDSRLPLGCTLRTDPPSRRGRAR
jgi:DNA-binding MarR family transcriptional regulator